MAQRGWLRVEKRKAGETWVLRFEVTRPIDGKRVEHTRAIGLVRDYPTESLARAEADRQCPNLNEATFSGTVTFRQIAEYFLTEEAANETRAASTLEDRNRIVTTILVPRWGTRVALSITVPEIKKWKRDYQEAKGIRDATMKKILDVMDLIYRLAIEDGLVPLTAKTNPVRPIKRSAETDYKAVIVEPKQALAVLLNLEQPERTLTLLVCATGLRISEALGLKWEDIDCEHSRINIVRACSGGVVSKPKTKASQAPVPLHPILEAFLREWQKESMYSGPEDWVFASTRRKGKQPRVANMLVEDHLRPAAIKAGVALAPGTRFGFHNLRHSLATFLVNSGTDAKTVQTLLRHADVSTTLQLYVQGSSEKGLLAQESMLDAIGLPLPGRVN